MYIMENIIKPVLYFVGECVSDFLDTAIGGAAVLLLTALLIIAGFIAVVTLLLTGCLYLAGMGV